MALGAPDSYYLDNLCILCRKQKEPFTEEGLPWHCWKHYLIPTNCSHCRQVVEVASLIEHMLTECGSKDTFRKCYCGNKANT